MDTSNSKRISPREFYEAIERFFRKCEQGKSLPSQDVKDFYEIIKQAAKPVSKSDQPSASRHSDPNLNAKITRSLQSLMTTLDKNKAVVESVAASIPYSHFERALNVTLEQYLEEQERQSSGVQSSHSAENMDNE